MLRGLTGNTAIVTGGATMIGEAVVAVFHEAGARVVIADIDPKGQGVADRLGEGVVFHKTDITDDDQIAACVDAAVARFGGVRFLVNLACSYVDQGLASTRAEWLTTLNVNLASAALRGSARGGGGRPVLVLRQRLVRDGRRLRGGRRLHGDGAGASRPGHSKAHGIADTIVLGAGEGRPSDRASRYARRE